MTTSGKSMGIYYEHPKWFKPLFAELGLRSWTGAGCPTCIDAAHHLYDPTELESPYALVVNRMSSSA